MKDYKIITIITARGGSKGLPGKNIKKLNKLPLINYTINAALKSNYVSKVILSTDSQKIAKVGKIAGAEVPFIRPKKLAGDTSHHPDVVKHAVKFVEKKEKMKFEYVIMLQPTSPFRTEKHLDEAIRKYLKERNDCLISIKKQDYPPWWMFGLKDNKLTTVFKHKKNTNVFNLERQQFIELYRPNGAIYITKRDSLFKTNNLVNPNSCGYYIMDSLDSIDIDNLSDFKLSEILFNEWKLKNK